MYGTEVDETLINFAENPWSSPIVVEPVPPPMVIVPFTRTLPVNIGAAENTSEPEPVSSLRAVAMSPDAVVPVNADVPLPIRRPVRVVAPVPPRLTGSVPVVSASAMPSDDVATWVHVLPAPPISKLFCVTDVRPVPPYVPPIALPFQIPEVTVPSVELVLTLMLAKLAVPVNIGPIESARLPVPVVPVTSDIEDAKFASVMVELRFFDPSVATNRDAVRPDTVSAGVVSAPVTEILVVPVPPKASVLPEILVVEAVVKYDAPDTVRAVDDAYGKVFLDVAVEVIAPAKVEAVVEVATK